MKGLSISGFETLDDADDDEDYYEEEDPEVRKRQRAELFQTLLLLMPRLHYLYCEDAFLHLPDLTAISQMPLITLKLNIERKRQEQSHRRNRGNSCLSFTAWRQMQVLHIWNYELGADLLSVMLRATPQLLELSLRSTGVMLPAVFLAARHCPRLMKMEQHETHSQGWDKNLTKVKTEFPEFFSIKSEPPLHQHQLPSEPLLLPLPPLLLLPCSCLSSSP